MVQCILVNKIVFIGLESWTYTHITIKGKGITVTELDRHEAREIIEDENLVLAKPDDYDDYNHHYGKIYTDGRFKNYLNKYTRVKKNLFKILDRLDDVG